MGRPVKLEEAADEIVRVFSSTPPSERRAGVMAVLAKYGGWIDERYDAIRRLEGDAYRATLSAVKARTTKGLRGAQNRAHARQLAVQKIEVELGRRRATPS